MVNQIGNNRTSLVVTPSNEVAVVKDSADLRRELNHRNLIIPQRGNDLPPSMPGEKGTLVDLYI